MYKIQSNSNLWIKKGFSSSLRLLATEQLALPLWDVLFSKSLAEQSIPSKMVDHDEMKDT
jgi:hypothetical protein